MQLFAKILEGRFVRLEPITPEHKPELGAALNCDPDSWEIMSVNGCGDGFETFWNVITAEAPAGSQIAYAIREKQSGRVVGTTSFLNIRREHRGVEVGATFIHPDVRSGFVNPESKRLLLGQAFETAEAIRVEFMIDERNSRSQAAVLKLGATREGSLRNHKVTWTGHVRDTVVLSICDFDWPSARDRLDMRLKEYAAA